MATLGRILTAAHLLEKSRRGSVRCAINGRYVEDRMVPGWGPTTGDSRCDGMLPLRFSPVTMHQPSSAEERSHQNARIAETEWEAADLRQHLAEVIEGVAFRGSHRSGQFLTYIVEQAIAGHFESLKERVIGVELFGRSPSYDTGDDAIVRVTASDVRRRLLQHYGKYGSPSGLRISLPLGSYLPVVSREITGPSSPSAPKAVGTEIVITRAEPVLAPHELPRSAPVPAHLPEATAPQEVKATRRMRGTLMAVALTALIFSAAGIFVGRNFAQRNSSLVSLPWSAFVSSPHATQIITSDPAIAEVQELTGRPISVSDYANGSYLPSPGTVSPETLRIGELLLRGANPAVIDSSISVSIAALGQSLASKLHVHSARALRMDDLKTDDNFIFLGSPRSNPWTALFADQLDFRFVFNKEAGQEIIQDVQPRPQERAEYRPTALGGGTGESFAIVALVQNLDQNGQVLLLAGADAEGTEAAARFVTDPPRLSSALQACGVGRSGLLQHFEFLLRLNTMAGSPNDYDVVACHLLPGPSLH